MPVRPLLLFAVTIALLLLPARPAGAQDRLAITSVNIVGVAHGSVRRDQTVLVEGYRIAAVGDAHALEVPAGTVVIDGNGKFLIPGLWDMHVHTGNDRNTREVVYPLLVAHGVTGIREMHADCFECPNRSIYHVNAQRRAVAGGELLGPRVVASSVFAGSYGQAAKRSTEGSSPQAPGTEADARAFVRLAKERGVDFIKVYDMLPREAYFALIEEANRLGLPAAGHVPVEVRASEASDAGQASIEHVGPGNVLEECSSREDELRPQVIAELGSEEPEMLPLMLEMLDSYDAEKCTALFGRFVANGTWVTPTLMVSRLPSELGDGWREDPYARFLTPGERRIFEEMEESSDDEMGDPAAQASVSRWVREVTRAMHRAGVPILAGSDPSIPGIFWGVSLHQELELLISAGFTEAEALRATTLGPAEFLEATDSLGSVEPGKVADLVLLEANPLEDISNTQRIAAVVLRGRYLNRAALDGMLADAERAAQKPLPANAQQEHPVEGHGPEVTVYLPGLRHPNADADAEDRIVEEDVVTVADSLVEQVRDRIESEVTPLLRELVDAGLVYKAELRQRGVEGERQEIRLVVTYPPVTVSPDARSEASRRAGGQGWLAGLPGEVSGGIVSVESVAGLTDRQLQRRAAEIHASHVAASIADARERGMSAADQGRRAGEIFSRSKGQRRWGHASHWLAFHALAKVADAPYEIEYGDAAFTLRSRPDRLQRFLTMYGSNIDEYVSWLRGMHEEIGAAEWYTMTAELDGDWLVETYRDHPRPDLVPLADMRASPPTPAEAKRYVGTYLLTATTGDPSLQWKLSIREAAGVAWVGWHLAGERPGRDLHLLSLGDGTFAPGWYSGAGAAEVMPGQTLRFTGENHGSAVGVEFHVANDEETVLFRFQRQTRERH